MTNSTKIETQTCTRCAGSGSYSYCQMHGSTCFKCGGSGKTYTKRGAAAAAFLKALREVPAESIVVGDIIYETNLFGTGGKFHAVTEVAVGNAKEQGCYSGDGQYTQVKLTTSKCISYHLPGAMVRKGYTGAEKAEHMAQTLAYQDTLGINGKPLKAKAARRVNEAPHIPDHAWSS